MFLEDEQDDILEDDELEKFDAEEDEYGIEDEETLEELDVDARGHVRPRRRSRSEDYEEPAEY